MIFVRAIAGVESTTPFAPTAVRVSEYDYVYTLTLAAVGANGVVDSTPAIARTKIIRERRHGG